MKLTVTSIDSMDVNLVVSTKQELLPNSHLSQIDRLAETDHNVSNKRID